MFDFNWHRLYALASAPVFYNLAGKMVLPLAIATILLFAFGLAGGLLLAPADYQQGEAFRIMYVHVPAAWMSLFVYMVIATSGLVSLVWRVKVADAIGRAAAVPGAMFTALALATGSIWGKPMWGAWWVWGDARLMSELVLLFLYMGYIGLQSAIPDRRSAARAGAVLALAGVVNIPIIHYSVIWWSTLHQGPSVSRLAAPAIHSSMLSPLLLMALAYMCYFFLVLMIRCRCELLQQEWHRDWVRAMTGKGGGSG